MTTGIQLKTLRCLKCDSNLKGEAEGVFVYCAACGSGFELNAQDELIAVPVYFARPGPQQQSTGESLPFWAFNAQLKSLQRKANKSLFSKPKGLSRLFDERGAIRFYVPAWIDDLQANRPKALQLTYDQPELEYIRAQSDLPGVVVSSEDARKIADYLFLTSEIEQSDTVEDLQYQLELGDPFIVLISY